MTAPAPGGSLARLLPVVTPAPAAPGAGRARPPGPSGGSSGVATSLTAESGVISSRRGTLMVLAISVALGIAVFGAWFTVAGPGRRRVIALARRGRHSR